MAEVKFGINEQPVAAPVAVSPTVAETMTAAAAPVSGAEGKAAVVAETVAAATAPPAAPGAAFLAPSVRGTTALGPSGLVLGDKIPDFSEIILPRLNIVQNIGKLQESFDNGALVLNQQDALFIPPLVNSKTGIVEREATPPVRLTVLGFRPTRYCEKVPNGGKGMIVNTEADVRNNGGTLDYAEWNLKKAAGMKRFEPLADALVAIERPAMMADDDTVFVYEVDGKKLALALWALRGTAYTAAAKRVFFTARACGCLRQGYPTWQYDVSTREETYDSGNRAWIPVCLPKVKTTPVFMDFVRSVLSAPAAE
jgi:hypothetical protein